MTTNPEGLPIYGGNMKVIDRKKLEEALRGEG